MAETDLELLQFPYSHFNEKVRWALDWKRLPHRRTNLLPGPHAPRIRRIAPDTTVPVLRLDGQVIQGSARILDALERRAPQPPLYPADPSERERALEIQRWFDEAVGPEVRRALFHGLMDEGAYVCRMFGEGHGLPVRVLYRMAFPVARRLIAREYRFSEPGVLEVALERTREGLDFVAKESAATGYLVGDRFGVADLTAASLLAVTCNPPDCAMTRPEPYPDTVARWLARWEGHAGTAWVLRMYREHRPPSAAR